MMNQRRQTQEATAVTQDRTLLGRCRGNASTRGDGDDVNE